MTYDVLLTTNNNQEITARVLSLPDIIISGTNEADVLAQVRDTIQDLRKRSRLVRLDIPAIGDNDPWLPYAGMWQNTPDWHTFQAEIENYRQAIEATTNT